MVVINTPMVYLTMGDSHEHVRAAHVEGDNQYGN
jgi:hypothetical protein